MSKIDQENLHMKIEETTREHLFYNENGDQIGTREDMVMMMMMMMNCFCGIVDRRKAEPYFQPGALSEIFTIANLQHAASRI